MGRGFLAGTFWGGLLGAVLLFISSQALERQGLSFPKPQASAVEVPAGSEFDQAKPETQAALPQTETRPAGELASGVPIPDDTQDEPPVLDTSALQVPTPEVSSPEPLETVAPVETEVPAPPPGDRDTEVDTVVTDLGEPEVPANAPDTDTDVPAISFVDPVDTAPEAGTDESQPVVDTDVAALAPPADEDAGLSVTDSAPAVPSATDAPDALSAPEIETGTVLPSAEEASDVITSVEPETPVQPEAETGALPDETETSSLLKPVDELTTTQEVETDRLPRVTDEASEDEPTETAALPTVRRVGDDVATGDTLEAEATDGEEAAQDDSDVSQDLPALQRFASEFENPNADPILSIILVQNGALLNEMQLSNLPANLSFAVDAGAPAATITAEHYRALGREVVMIPSLPKLATPQDVEQALQINFQTVPEAVAVMDVSGGSFQADRAAVAQVVDVVTNSGHGLITYPRGLNTAHQRAERAGVATGLIFRQIDANGETLQQINRTLDRAAFRARQEDGVILVGTTDDTTLIALLEWAQGNRAASVALAPVSAALSQQ